MSGLRSPNFLKFWIGQGLAQVGGNITAVAFPVVAVDYLAASEQDLGRLAAARTAAFLVVGLPAGALVDRWFKRRTMIRADLVRCAAAAAIPLLWFLGMLQMWHLLVVAAITGVATVFFDVSYQSLIPSLVPKDEIAGANARLETTSQVAMLGGPALGGLALKAISAPAIMIADALGYLASVLFLAITRDGEQLKPPGEGGGEGDKHPPLVGQIREGLAFVLTHPALRRIILSTAFSNFFINLAFTLLPLVVLKRLGLSPFELGLLLTAGSIGGIAGGVLTPRAGRAWGTGPTMRRAVAVGFVAAMLVPVAGQWLHGWTAWAVLAVSQGVGMLSMMLYNITQISMRQRLCPHELLGRMNASIRFIVWGVLPIAGLLAGVCGEAFGLMPTMWLGAAGSFLALVPLLGIDPHLPAEEVSGDEAAAEQVTTPPESSVDAPPLD